MKNRIVGLKKFLPLLIFLGALLLIVILGSDVVKADLGGSKVTFVPAPTGTTGGSCYIPDRIQTLCFSLESVTSDGESPATMFMKFPAGWTVSQHNVEIVSKSCENGGTIGSLIQSNTPYGLSVNDGRAHNTTDRCTAVYCWTVDTDQTATSEIAVPWVWFGDDSGVGPHRPCSNDDYYPDNHPDINCDEHDAHPPAVVPICEHVTLNILPETLPAGEVGAWYSQQLSVESGTGPFSWSSLGLPMQMGIDYSTGMLVGTPTTAETINFTAKVKGPEWSDGSRAYSLIIHPALTFNPDVLPAARVNTAYNQMVSVSGRTDETPVLTHESGTLPGGITFSGSAFSGTPTETGTFVDIVIKATYTDGLVKTRAYTLNVLPEHLFTWDPAEPDEKANITFTPIAGYSSYYWRTGWNPGEDCAPYGNYGYPTFITSFWESGEFKVCLQFWSGTEMVYDSQWVTVNNIAPEINHFRIQPSPSFPGMSVSGVIEFDRGPTPYTCQVDWGEGAGPQSFPCVNTYASLPAYTYSTGGTFTIQVSVTDGDGLTTTDSVEHDVVYVIALPSEVYLASNSVPTVVEVWGAAAVGHTPLNFNFDTSLTEGSLETPALDDCVLYDEEFMVCRATVPYIPSPDTGSGLYNGYDSFDFYVDDGQGHSSNTVRQTLWVDENAASTALDGSAIVSAVAPTLITLQVTDPDVHIGFIHDRFTFIIDDEPNHGTLEDLGYIECNTAWDGYGTEFMSCSSRFLYTPGERAAETTDSFTFYVNDSHHDSNSATFDLTLYTPKTLIVNTTEDGFEGSGCSTMHCSLREAVEDVVIGDIIAFDLAYPATIILEFGSIHITKDLVINGPGADKLAISADENSRVFTIGNDEEVPVTAKIAGVTIRDGRASEGGGVFIEPRNTLIMEDCVVGPNNIVTYAGGGIFNELGILTLNRCTVIENEGTGTLGGAGITTVGGAITTLINSTVSGNITNNYGGGLYVAYGGLVRLIHSTVSGNIANFNYLEKGEEHGGGAGIYIDMDGEVELHNSIVAGNTDMSDPTTAGHEKWHDVHGEVTSLGGNLIGVDTGSSGWDVSDLVGNAADPVDPLLDDLRMNAPGKTLTYALLQGSLAIDAVPCVDGITEDQRGVARPQGTLCDIGAYEAGLGEFIYHFPLFLR